MWVTSIITKYKQSFPFDNGNWQSYMGWIQRKSQKSDVDCWGCPKSDPDYSQTECSSQFLASQDALEVMLV